MKSDHFTILFSKLCTGYHLHIAFNTKSVSTFYLNAVSRAQVLPTPSPHPTPTPDPAFTTQYLSELYTPARQFHSASDTRTIYTPPVNMKTVDKRSFSCAGPSIWNCLHRPLRHSDFSSSFRIALKTHLFQDLKHFKLTHIKSLSRLPLCTVSQ